MLRRKGDASLRLGSGAFLLIVLAVLLVVRSAVGQPKRPIDLLLSHGLAVTMDQQRRILTDAAIAVQGDTILAIGPTGKIAAEYEARKANRCAWRAFASRFDQCSYTSAYEPLPRSGGGSLARRLAHELYISRRSA
jgi:hypothetical protein